MFRVVMLRKANRLAFSQRMDLRSAFRRRLDRLSGARRQLGSQNLSQQSALLSPTLPPRTLREWIRHSLKFGLRLCLVICILLASCVSPGAPAVHPQRGAGINLPNTFTPTPFQPVSATQRAPSIPMPGHQLPVTGQAKGHPGLTTVFQGIALDDASQPVQVLITPITASVNHGRPIAIRFWPGQPCAYDDHRACVSAHVYAPSSAPLTLITIHSGVGGEGQALRNALEGTGVNRAGFSLEQIAQNQYELQDSAVTLSQGQARADAYRVVENLHVLAVVRVPAGFLEPYFSTAFADALNQLAQRDAALKSALTPGRPLLILETCGWRHPEEAPAPGVTDTTGSIYLLVVG